MGNQVELRRLRVKLKTRFNYDRYTKHDVRCIRDCFVGTGMLCNSNDLGKLHSGKAFGYDINSCYPYILKTCKFPVNRRMPEVHKGFLVDYDEFIRMFNVNDNDLFLVGISFDRYVRKFSDLDYSTYFHKVTNADGSNEHYYYWGNSKFRFNFVLTSIDLANMMKLYELEGLKIWLFCKFDGDYIPQEASDYVDELYQMKQQNREFKLEFNKITSGKFVQRLQRFKADFNCSVDSYDNWSVLGIWIYAYARARMIDLIVRYHDRLIYMDTDSIFLDGVQLESGLVGSELGNFKCEFANSKIYVFNVKNYAVYDSDGNVIKQAHAGMNHDIDDEHKPIDRFRVKYPISFDDASVEEAFYLAHPF